MLQAVPADRNVGFWYGDQPTLTSIQSIFLYDFTRVFDNSDRMPTVTPTLLTNIAQFDYLVLLGLKPGEVTRGTDALCAAGVSLKQVGRRTIRGDDSDLTFAIFRRADSGGCTKAGGTA